MEHNTKESILARTTPRIKRPATPTERVRMGADKFATGSTTPPIETKSTDPTRKHLNGRHRVKIGQWNVRGLNALGKLSILGNEMERLDISMCGLSETKWSGSGHFKTLDGHTVLYSGKTGREHHGVAIWINKNTSSSLASYNPISNRVILATFNSKPRDVTIVQCYAPTVDKQDEEIEQFYRDLAQAITDVPKRNILLITGDFNARVGEDATETDVLGKYGHGKRNDRGQTLVDFCAEHRLVVSNTLFRLHNRHRYTWRSPDGSTRAQIDYILINKQWKQSINNARVCLSADCDSDHNLLILTMKLRFRKKRVNKPLLLDLEELKNFQVEQQYQVEVKNRFKELEKIDEPRTPDELWQQLKKVTLGAAEATLQKNHCKRKNWISNDTFEWIKRKREVKTKSTEEYRNLRYEVQKRLRKDKQEELDTLCSELEENAKLGNSRLVFQTVKRLTGSFVPHTTAINDTTGKKIVDPEKVNQRWKEYCEELYKEKDENVDIVIQEGEPPPLKEEIRRAVMKSAMRKVPGPDNVAAELLRFGGEMTVTKLHEICAEVWRSGVWPEEWTQSTFIPLPKKGDPLQCENYRTIALVSHASKILLRVILERMQHKLEEEIAQEQAGFRPRRGTRDQIVNLKIILEKAKERNQPLYLCFIDFTKAFDMIRHDKLWLTMLEMGFPPQLVQLLRNLYRQQRANVKTDGRTSAWFRVNKGVRQGCNLSPCLFNILAEQVMRKALMGFAGGFRIGGKTISNLRYADDIVLLATTPEELQELVNRVESAAREYDMSINARKTKVMTNTDDALEIEVSAGRLEQVNSFVYLGSRVTKDADCASEVKSRLAMGMAVMIKLTKLWKNKSISSSTKLRLMKTLVWPVATYGCEAWTLKKEEERRIQAFENKCIRKLLRIPWIKLMTNDRVYLLAGARKDLLVHVRTRKLRYFGHTMRNPIDNIEGSLMTGLVEGNRGRGRPRISWIDNILKWTGLSGTGLMSATRNRRHWAALVHSCSQPSRSDDGELT